jgi:glutamate-1-semialdehyde aminotransferase/spore coat polysaccharide biosynthesis protein SpsF (cytidylyltransferase family)
MKTIAIIQARMGSSRLPGKVLVDIEGRPMLQRVVERARLATLLDEVVIATTDRTVDDPVAKLADDLGIPCYRGSESDVLDRFYQTALSRMGEVIVRLTADCPLLDPGLIDRVVQPVTSGRADYSANILKSTYPDGLDCEAFTIKALEQAWAQAKKGSDREHVTPYLRNSGKFSMSNVEEDGTETWDDQRWTVDQPEDLHFVRAVYARFEKKADFTWRDVLRELEKEPQLAALQQKTVSNEGYYAGLYKSAKGGAAPVRSLAASFEWRSRAEKVIPGGAQTFSKSGSQYVKGVSPVFLERGKGCRVWDVDGNEYIDYVQGLLPNILGYAHDEVNAAFAEQAAQGHSFSLSHPVEVKLAEKLVEIIPCAEMVRFGKNGSDATAGAVRVARAFTVRERIACCGYHGWQDWFIGTTSRDAGVPGGVKSLTHSFPYNDLESLEGLLDKHQGEFAAVIMEPFNFVPPKEGYLEGVKKLAHKHGALLIFDEICTGFHFGLGGSQTKFGVVPDLACFGKAMGNGYPISCLVGRAEVMRICEKIFFSFTFGGEAASMAAALKVIQILEETDAIRSIKENGRRLQDGFNALAKTAGLQNRFVCEGYPNWSILRFRDADGRDSLLERSLWQQECVKRGILQLVTHNMTAANDHSSTDQTLEVYAEVFKTLSDWLSDGNPSRFLEGEMIQPVFRVRG